MQLKKYYVIFFYLFIIFQKTNAQDAQIPLGQEMLGVASFYHLPGNLTASGETMQKNGLTCAHRWYPFGTMLEVTNVANNRWVVVKVTDRGPFSGGRMLDVSMDAAKALGMIQGGLAKIKIMVVGDNGQIYITRSEPIIDKAIEDTVDNKKEPVPILPQPEDKKKEKEQEKKVAEKRENRRKN